MKRNSPQQYNHPLRLPPPPNFSSFASSSSPGNMWDGSKPDAGVDELLAMLGYQVKASEMGQVAQRLEQLEQVMGHAQEDGGASQLGSCEVNHYNPSDMSSWLDSMISEINPDNQFQSPSDYDLTAIPGRALYPQSTPGSPPPNKRFRTDSGSSSSLNWDVLHPSVVGESTRPMVVVDSDSQENGVRLVHALLACAEAVQQQNLGLAKALVKQISFLAVSQPGAMRKVATYFAEGLARRIFSMFPETPLEPCFSDNLFLHFYETCPYLKFAHFTANQAILEAFTGKQFVHVIDLGLKQGMQWPVLMQALALRPGGPPIFRLTGIGPPSSDNIDRLQEVGLKLARFAESVNVPFEFKGLITNSLAELEAPIFNIREGEAVAVNSMFVLHELLAELGGIEKVLSMVKEMKPEILIVAEQEGNNNGPGFVNRFNESLNYYASLFDSLEAGGESSVLSEIYLGRQICNVVATEGVDRVERYETLAQWRTRLGSAGFESVHLGSNAFKQASMLLAHFNGGGGYRVEEDNGCLTLGWHTRQLIAASAWKPCQN